MSPELAAHLRYEHGWSWKRLMATTYNGTPRSSSARYWRWQVEAAAERMGYVTDEAS